MRVSEGQKFSLTRIFRHFLSFRLILENYSIESKRFHAYRVQRKKYYRVISVLRFFGFGLVWYVLRKVRNAAENRKITKATF